MPTIRIDDEVWAWLKGLAKPLEDTPNSVLRRVAGLDVTSKSHPEARPADAVRVSRALAVGNGGSRRHHSPRRVMSGLSGSQLNVEWKVNARHALYSKNGNWFMPLERFPGALFDPSGYVLFKTEEQYRNNRQLQHGKRLAVPGGIASMSGYVQVRRSA